MSQFPAAAERATQSTLRRVLLADAGFSGISGIVLAAGCIPVDRLIGLGMPVAVAAIGIGLLPYSWSLLREARRPSPRPGEVALFAILDLAWVAASLLLLVLLTDRLTTAGLAAIASIGIVVLGFAGAKAVALARRPGTQTG